MRKRLIYGAAIILVVAFGLSTRKFPGFFPYFISHHFGDALWAAMVYFGFRFIFYKKPLLISGLLSLVFSFLIELSQLYQAPWINELRFTTLGALILGHGFLLVDLVRYTAGVCISLLSDLMMERLRIF